MKDQVCILFVKESARVHPEMAFMGVILRSPASGGRRRIS